MNGQEPGGQLKPLLLRMRVGIALERYRRLCNAIAEHPPIGDARWTAGAEFFALVTFLDENIDVARDLGYRRTAAPSDSVT